jgi:hypothetical protein
LSQLLTHLQSAASQSCPWWWSCSRLQRTLIRQTFNQKVAVFHVGEQYEGRGNCRYSTHVISRSLPKDSTCQDFSDAEISGGENQEPRSRGQNRGVLCSSTFHSLTLYHCRCLFNAPRGSKESPTCLVDRLLSRLSRSTPPP